MCPLSFPSVNRDGTGNFELLEIMGAVPYFDYSALSHIISDSEEAKWFKHLSELDSINPEICPQFKYSYHTLKTEIMGPVLCPFSIAEHHLRSAQKFVLNLSKVTTHLRPPYS